MTGVYRLRGRVRHYDWGGERFLPGLLGRQSDGRPWAEYWLGAHPGDPAEVRLASGWHSLEALIDADPGRWLGPEVADRFGQLPYLMKVLDVARPLSIQVHPDRAQAQAGFERENALGISMTAPERNFKDCNHKPELALAVSDFWLLYGFRPTAEIAHQLSRFGSLAELVAELNARGPEGLFLRIMTAEEDLLQRWLLPVLEAVAATTAGPDEPTYWIDWWRQMHASSRAALDRGLLGFLIMRLVRLRPGETIFQGPNVPHTYLRGQAVEIMANSDNVLRGGLTRKHVDPLGLAQHIVFDAGGTAIAGEDHCIEFDFLRLVAEAGQSVTLESADAAIILLLEGRATVDGQDLTAGQAVFVAPGCRPTVRCREPLVAVVAKPGQLAA